jgi:hypothetical protein
MERMKKANLGKRFPTHPIGTRVREVNHALEKGTNKKFLPKFKDIPYEIVGIPDEFHYEVKNLDTGEIERLKRDQLAANREESNLKRKAQEEPVRPRPREKVKILREVKGEKEKTYYVEIKLGRKKQNKALLATDPLIKDLVPEFEQAQALKNINSKKPIARSARSNVLPTLRYVTSIKTKENGK